MFNSVVLIWPIILFGILTVLGGKTSIEVNSDQKKLNSQINLLEKEVELLKEDKKKRDYIIEALNLKNSLSNKNTKP